MHRAYQPITPANNMLLKKRWDISRYNAHRHKVSITVLRGKQYRIYLFERHTAILNFQHSFRGGTQSRAMLSRNISYL